MTRWTYLGLNILASLFVYILITTVGEVGTLFSGIIGTVFALWLNIARAKRIGNDNVFWMVVLTLIPIVNGIYFFYLFFSSDEN